MCAESGTDRPGAPRSGHIVGTARRPKNSAWSTAVLLVVAAVLVAATGCTPVAETTGTDQAPFSRYLPGGEVLGLVAAEPLTLDEAGVLAADIGGDLLALYRADYVCALPVTFGALEWEPEPSRFVYFDAPSIRERRLDAIDKGLSPPITGWRIAESFWDHWEDQWARAQDPAVRFEALAVYLPEGSADGLGGDPRLRAVVPLPQRRTESLSPDFPGELLLESEEFPPGVLSAPPLPDCTE